MTAGELARVLRPGGRMGVLTWTPTSDIAQFIRATVPHLPPPPPTAQSPLLWGDEAHVRGIFATTGLALIFDDGDRDVPDACRCRRSSTSTVQDFGPLVAARAMLEPQGRWQALADDVDAFFAGRRTPTGRSPS